MTRTHANELEEKERAHTKELAAIRLQLDRAIEINKIKVCLENPFFFFINSIFLIYVGT